MDQSAAANPLRAARQAFHLSGYALHFALMALLPLINALLFDWDAGMVAALLIVENLTVLLLMPLLWLGIDLAWQRRRERAEAAAAPAGADAGERPPFPWLRKLAGYLLLCVVVLAFGGLLPIFLLSLSAPQWFDWSSNLAVTEFGVPAPLTLILWPFVMAWALAGEWWTFTASVAVVIALALVRTAAVLRQVLHDELDPQELEDDATAQLALVSVPLFIMAGVALAAGAWFAERRVLPDVMAGQDAALWALVALVALRALAAGLMAQDQSLRRGASQGDRAQGRAALKAVAATGFGLLLLLAGALLISSPKSTRTEGAQVDCLATWPGEFRPDTRAVLQPRDDDWMADTALACERLGNATSLRLPGAIDPRDLDWFSSVRSVELSGEGLRHAADLQRLPALARILIQGPEPFDARTLKLPAGVELLAFNRIRLRHAEALWRLRDLHTLAFNEVVLEDTAAVRGRTAIRRLALTSVSGYLNDFLHGALGVESLRLSHQALRAEDTRRLLWLRRLDFDAGMSATDYCELIEHLYSVRGTRARACGRRFAVPD
jgi:hypothetical protein